MKLISFALVWMYVIGGQGEKINVKVYTLSEPITVPLPSPPNCYQTSHPHYHPVPVELTLWKISLGESIGFGYYYRRSKVTTLCSSNWLGMKTMTMVAQSPLMTWGTHVKDHPIEASQLDVEVDVTATAAYNCRWNSDVEQVSERIYATRVNVYMNYGGRLVANDLEWEVTTDPRLWSNKNDKLQILFDYKESCAFQAFKVTEGFLTLTASGSYVFLGTTDHLRLVLDEKRKEIGCDHVNSHLYPTDVGLPVSLNVSVLKFDQRTPSGVTLVAPPSDAVFKADILFEYDTLVKQVNENFETLDRHLCMERKIQWASAVRSADPNQLAHFVSRDPFAQGAIVKGDLQIRVRKPLLWDLHLSDIYIDTNNTIKVNYLNAIHSIDSASGIVNFSSPNTFLLPPLLELSSGSYYDLRLKTASRISQGRWLHSDISVDPYESTITNDIAPGKEHIWNAADRNSFKYEGFWSSWKHASHLLVLIICGITGFLLVCLCCLGRICSIVSRYPNIFPPRTSGSPSSVIQIDESVGETVSMADMSTQYADPSTSRRRGSHDTSGAPRTRSRSPRLRGWEAKYHSSARC